jgi:hypothetical protein
MTALPSSKPRHALGPARRAHARGEDVLGRTVLPLADEPAGAQALQPPLQPRQRGRVARRVAKLRRGRRRSVVASRRSSRGRPTF